MHFSTEIFPILFAASAIAVAVPEDGLDVEARATVAPATVSLTNHTGTPGHLASGIIFGVPDNAAQIPDNMYREWGFNFLRAGGAQLPPPRDGWLAGRSNFEASFLQALGDYHTAQKYGAKFILLFEALYGQWDVENGPYPGDNGNWTSWDAMTQAVIADMKTYNVSLNDFIIDIFNESDGPWYWTRGQAQAFEMWRRTYAAFKQAFGSSVTIQGPSFSAEPSTSNSWWSGFAKFVKSNNCVPDTWTWHMESGGGNMLESTANLHTLLNANGLPYNNININEYAVSAEQVPSGAAWWISQLERVNAPGLRGNWQSYPGLYDYLANLVSKPGAPSNTCPTSTGYYPVGEYQVYKYYNLNMTGTRLGTNPTSDMAVDVYATLDTSARTVKVLAGSRIQTGTWTIEIQNVTSLGLPQSGSVTLQCRQFVNNGTWGAVNSIGSCGTFNNTYSNNVIDIVLYQRDTATAYAWEFSY